MKNDIINVCEDRDERTRKMPNMLLKNDNKRLTKECSPFQKNKILSG